MDELLQVGENDVIQWYETPQRPQLHTKFDATIQPAMGIRILKMNIF